MLEHRPVSNGGDAGVLRAIAHTDVHGAVVADNLHLRTRGLCRFGFRLRLGPLSDIVISHSSHQRGVGLVTILAVLLQASFLLESLHGGLGFAAEIAVNRQGRAKLVQQLLEGFYIPTNGAFFQQTTAQGVGHRFGRLYGSRIAVIDERQLGPVFPGPFLHHGFHAAVVEAAPLDSTPAADIVADMTVHEQRETHDLRQRVNRAPVHALALAVGEHPAGGFVRAAVGAIFTGVLLIRANALQHTLAAIRPGISLAAAHTVGHYLLVGDVLLISGSAAGTVMGRILPCFAVQHGCGRLVNTGSIPVGALFRRHFQTPVSKMLVGERSIDSLRHDDTSSHEKRAAVILRRPGRSFSLCHEAGTGCRAACPEWAGRYARHFQAGSGPHCSCRSR